ncbi:hypothetical protein CPB83DRAFT_909939 [Crepidotus variabilis]|uniref:Uncharacterized protein n=1 Tax=Crepidotus variabilis TaxID=179855 RepID=A0A9P6E829_9AGAR|nr:hypothetical protein CPB83DRAFT_909939 [Crepidotus variabilis]
MVLNYILTGSFFFLVLASQICSKDVADVGNRNAPDSLRLNPGFNIHKVVETSKKLPSRSWEFGTESEALLELYNPELSIHGNNPSGKDVYKPDQVKALVYAKEKIVIGTGANALSDDRKYANAAKDQVEYVYGGAPRWFNGAISHRVDHPALWADFIYMAPPYLAYCGVVENNATTLREAVDQISLYHDVLRMNVTTNATGVPPTNHKAVGKGSWEDIIDINPNASDSGLWSTGNGWAAAGAMRVLATVIKAPKNFTDGFRQDAITRVSSIIRDILDAAIRMPRADNNLLRNYLDDPSWFGEISGSSVLASTAVRLATFGQEIGLTPNEAYRYAEFAQNIRLTLGNGKHISASGTAFPAINPLDWNDRIEFTQGSPEDNAFIGLLFAAWRDCVQANTPGCWRYGTHHLRRSLFISYLFLLSLFTTNRSVDPEWVYAVYCYFYYVIRDRWEQNFEGIHY